MRTSWASAICWTCEFLVTATLMQEEGLPAGHVVGQYIGKIHVKRPGLSLFSQGVTAQGRDGSKGLKVASSSVFSCGEVGPSGVCDATCR